MPIIKHGAHRLTLQLPPVAASGTIQTDLPYDVSYTTLGVYDSTSEVITRGSAVASAAWVAGDAVTLNHRNSTGTVVDAVSISTTAGANVTIDFTASTASTGNRINQGWTMAAGDSLELVVAATTTAGVRGGVGVMLLIDSRGA